MTKNRRRVLGAPDLTVGNASEENFPRIEVESDTIHHHLRSAADKTNESFNAATIYCPICNEQMISLIQLNRHLDEEHVEISEAVQEVGVRSWLQKQIAKSSKLAPVNALSRTLGLTEDFVRNGVSDSVGMEATRETDEVVDRRHWQHDSVTTRCGIQPCASSLKSKTINCRHCGRIFCDLHTRYQMRLSRSANYEPVRGIWCRVCKTCYESRVWYRDTDGLCRDLYTPFSILRKSSLNQKYLEINLQHKRLAKLLQKLNKLAQSQERPSLFRLLSSVNTERREIEQEFVEWENDEAVVICPHCAVPFTYLNKKHHCRLCGRVVCGNTTTRCSETVAFASTNSDDIEGSANINLRLCRDCKDSTFLSDHDSILTVDAAPAYQKSYSALQQYRSSIESLVPRFKKLLITLSDRTILPSKADMAEAKRVRSRLLDAFAQYDSIAKKVKNAPARCETETMLQNAIYQQATRYLQTHMITLQSIPMAMTKHADKEDDTIINTTMEALRIDEEQSELHQELAAFSEQRVSPSFFISFLKTDRQSTCWSSKHRLVNGLVNSTN